MYKIQYTTTQSVGEREKKDKFLFWKKEALVHFGKANFYVRTNTNCKSQVYLFPYWRIHEQGSAARAAVCFPRGWGRRKRRKLMAVNSSLKRNDRFTGVENDHLKTIPSENIKNWWGGDHSVIATDRKTTPTHDVLLSKK